MTDQTHQSLPGDGETGLGSRQTPVLIFVPGLGTSVDNTADALADVIAETADLQDAHGTYKAESAQDVVTPSGLTVSKRVTGPDGSPVLQLFQLGYRTTLDASTTPYAPSVGPGAVRTSALALAAAGRWLAAARNGGKGRAVKAQLFFLSLLVVALLFAAIVAVAALLVALGVPLGWFQKVVGTDEQVGAWVLGIAGVTGTITWAALRKKILAVAKFAESMVHFVGNDDQLADTIAKRLDMAINDLTDAGWTGPIHVLGYSFGSLVIFESMFPRNTSLVGLVPAQAVSSLTTIGLPLDIVRLYSPGYVEGRQARHPGTPWTNVFNAADVLASNLMDPDDTTEGPSTALAALIAPATSVRYTDETIGLAGILVTGRVHARYWSSPGGANCFGPLVTSWIP